VPRWGTPNASPSSSGIGPQRALEANTETPRAQRESPILPKASSASAGLIPRSAPPIPPTEVPSRPRLGTVWGMRRSFRTLRLCAIPGVSPRAGMRCPVGALRTPHPAERDRSAASLGSDHQNPSRTARKPNPSPSFLSERRTDPAERSTTASAGSIPRSVRLKKPVAEGFPTGRVAVPAGDFHP
jgi:hypothetical protein